MPTKTRVVTPSMEEANRQNSQKSTGPRTPEGKQQVRYNALKHGLYGKPCMQFMLAADEDPKEHQAILAGLTESFHPFTPAQRMLVEDLAMLRWQKRRNQRAQAAAISVALEELDINTGELRKHFRCPLNRTIANSRSIPDKARLLDFAHCGVRSCGQTRQICEERRRLANEESHSSQKLDRSRGCPRRLRRTDYRTYRQVGVDEGARFRHDQVGLEHLPDCIAR